MTRQLKVLIADELNSWLTGVVHLTVFDIGEVTPWPVTGQYEVFLPRYGETCCVRFSAILSRLQAQVFA